MTVMDFPSSPTNGQQTTDGRYYFDSSVGSTGAWRSTPLPVGGLPAGSIMQWSSSTLPANWLLCDGAAVSRSIYSSLFATIGTTYGTGDGSTTFNLPDIPNGTGAGIVGQAVGTSNISITNTTVADLAGMATTVNMKAGRTYKLTFSSSQMASQQTGSNRLQLIYVLNGTVWERQYFGNGVANNYGNAFVSESYYTAVADGSVAIKLQAFIDVGSGTFSFYADSGTSKNVFTVEDLGEGTASTVRQRHIIKTSAGWTAGDSELATRIGTLEQNPNITGALTVAGNATVNGSIFSPNRPMFRVTNHNGSTTTGVAKMSWNGVSYNVGNMWSTANNRFTAATPGYYFFSWTTLQGSTANHSNQLRKNGVDDSGSNTPVGYPYTNYMYTTAACSTTVYMAANDYVELWVVGGVAHSHHNYLTGYLLG